MIIVTGAAGFIGANLIAGLNARGETNILAVDDLSDGTKFRNLADLQIADYLDKDVGLRYFNVYDPREQHKAGMASTAFHFSNQIQTNDTARLFEGTDDYANGQQQRDFIHVDDVVAVNLWFYERPDKSGIYNCGTGRAQTFNEVANAAINWHGKGHIEYIPFPDKLVGRYQSYTQADLTKLRAAGYDAAFLDVATGVKRYMNTLHGMDRPE